MTGESLKKAINDRIEEQMASNGHFSSQVLLDAMDNLHQKRECMTFETKFHQLAQKYRLG
jgi:hypothetical protein